MIDLTGMISIPYLKKTVFTGSEKGKKTYQEFEFSEDGIKAAVAWLNEVT